MKEKIKTTLSAVRSSMLDDSSRIRLQFQCVYGIVMVISVFMTIVNIITGKRLLMYSTLVFAVLCGINMLLSRKSEKLLYLSGWIFSLEFIALLTFFVVSGTPEGFSVIWSCLLPASGLLLFQRKRGSALCAVMFLILIFFFDTPLGNSFLQYPYTESFKLRFPMLYIAFFAISFLLESIRSLTFDEMKKAQEKYEYLYRHDALTEVCNRYGFNERMDSLLSSQNEEPVSLLILDLDHFKRINDFYGHSFGDEVLKRVAALLLELVGPDFDVCRWGGEEFAILFSGQIDAVQFGEHLLEALRGLTIEAETGAVHITASIGIATAASNAGLSPALFVRAADACLYEAKINGRDTMVCAAIPNSAGMTVAL